MIRSLSLAALLATGLSLSAFAADEAAAPAADTASVTEYLAEVSKSSTASQIRQLLQAKGYTNVSGLAQDESGRWTGTAQKDGKAVGVAVAMPPKGEAAPSTN
jgi:hypothetical protein